MKPRRPNFKPSVANVATIAIWIRLSKLPIEYYDLEVLKQIEKSIRNVLRIDTHTASESRGRYARLCIQVDVEKPLTTLLIIEGIEQTISYEDIHKSASHVGKLVSEEMHARSWYLHLDKEGRGRWHAAGSGKDNMHDA